MREICITFQVIVILKPKYIYKMLKQMHIFDTKIIDLILQQTFLVNILVKLQSIGYTFYNIDLLLEYQNKEFKMIQNNCELFL